LQAEDERTTGSRNPDAMMAATVRCGFMSMFLA
jgi:hypothetical protein